MVGCAIRVHKLLGPGLLETVYQQCLKYELEENGFKVRQEVPVDVIYSDMVLDTKLRADLFVEDCIVVELKAIEKVLPVHEAVLMTYMKLLKAPQGLLINFFTTNIVKSVKPLVNEFFRALPDEAPMY